MPSMSRPPYPWVLISALLTYDLRMQQAVSALGLSVVAPR